LFEEKFNKPRQVLTTYKERQSKLLPEDDQQKKDLYNEAKDYYMGLNQEIMPDDIFAKFMEKIMNEFDSYMDSVDEFYDLGGNFDKEDQKSDFLKKFEYKYLIIQHLNIITDIGDFLHNLDTNSTFDEDNTIIGFVAITLNKYK
jgi:hypothetical protein